MLRDLALGLLILSGIGEPAVAQGAMPIPVSVQSSSNDSSVESVVALAYRTDALKQAFLSGDDELIVKAIGEIDLVKKEYGVSDLSPLVEAMCLWAIELGNNGKTTLARNVLEKIGNWEPQNPVHLSTFVTIGRLEGLAGFFQSLPASIKLSMARFENPHSKNFFIFQRIAWARFLASIVLWCVAATLVFRYHRFFSHIFERLFSDHIANRHVIAVISALIVALPVLIGLDLSFCAFVWLLLLTPILTATEMKLAIFCVLLQLLHPGLSLFEQKFVAKPIPISIELLQSQPQLVSLESMPIDKMSKTDRQFLLGWNALRSSSWKSAEDIFRELSSTTLDKAIVFNNLGVALQRQEKNTEALEAFVQAGLADSTAFEPPYNQAIINYMKFNPEQAEKKLVEARIKDPAKFRRVFSPMSSIASILEHITLTMPIRDTPDRVASMDNLYGEMYGEEAPILKKQTIDIDLATLVWVIWPVVGAIVLAIKRNNLTVFTKQYQCGRCGKSFQITHEVDSDKNTCTQCFHIFVLKDDAHTGSLQKKLKQVKLYKKSRLSINRWLCFFAPGLDKVFSGSSVSGCSVFVFLSACLGIVIFSFGSTTYPGEIVPDPPSILKYVALLLVGILYLQSWYKLFFAYHRS
ncbi:MAG: hypothetical protein FWG02_10805 [Holophagaceae bacterium]|nr:hypothetical protein [Holophagaceae bacterium]